MDARLAHLKSIENVRIIRESLRPGRVDRPKLDERGDVGVTARSGPVAPRDEMAADDPCEKVPIWLQDQQTWPPPPPARIRGVFWPRAVTLVIACGTVASLLYDFSVATSPPPEHQIDVAAGAPLASPIASGPPTQHSTEARGELPAGEPESEPAQQGALVTEPVIVPPASLRSTPATPAVTEDKSSPSPELTSAPATKPADFQELKLLTNRGKSGPPTQHSTEARGELPAGEPESEPAQQGALVTEPVIVPPASLRSTPATPAVTEDKSSPSELTSAPATKPADFQELKLLTDRGKQLFYSGDLVSARILFARAANAGDAAAALAMGATYDPVVLSERGVRGVAADLEKARRWYERAKEMGSPEGPRR